MLLQDASIPENRRKAQLETLQQLSELADRVYRAQYRSIVLDDDTLASLPVRKLAPLDVEEAAPFDPEPLFFRPYPVQKGEDFPATVLQKLVERPEWPEVCDGTTGGCGGGMACAGHRGQWFEECLGLCNDGIRKETGWDTPKGDLCDGEINTCCLDPQLHYERWDLRNADGKRYRYASFSDVVYCNAGSCRPHSTMSLFDSSAGESRTLRSEILAVISLLAWRYRLGEFVHHHKMPAMVYTFFGHSNFARLTQGYWDSNMLVIRQSRLFDLRGDQPTPDAYLFLRWMANTPVGETAYQPLPDQHDSGEEAPVRPQPNLVMPLAVQA